MTTSGWVISYSVRVDDGDSFDEALTAVEKQSMEENPGCDVTTDVYSGMFPDGSKYRAVRCVVMKGVN